MPEVEEGGLMQLLGDGEYLCFLLRVTQILVSFDIFILTSLDFG